MPKTLIKIAIPLLICLALVPLVHATITISESTISNVTYENKNILTILAYDGNASYDVNTTVYSTDTGAKIFDGYIGNILNNTETQLDATPFILGAGNYNATITVYNGTNTATATVSIFVTSKTSPSMSLTASPGTQVVDGTETIVKGTITTVNNQLTATLTCPTKTLTTATSVSDTERFNPGSYVYSFSTTGNANYTSKSLSLTLKVVPGSSGGGEVPSVMQKFTHKPTTISITKGEMKTITIQIEPKPYLRTARSTKPFIHVPTMIKPGQTTITVTIKPIEYAGNYTGVVRIYNSNGVEEYPINVQVTEALGQLPIGNLSIIIPLILIVGLVWLVIKK